jgi:hypothetical protein
MFVRRIMRKIFKCVWPCIINQVNNGTNRCNNNGCTFLGLHQINLYMFRPLLCPSSGDKKTRLVNTSCEGTWLCWLQLYGAAMWAVCTFRKLLLMPETCRDWFDVIQGIYTYYCCICWFHYSPDWEKSLVQWKMKMNSGELEWITDWMT